MAKKETTSETTARLILHESQQSPERSRSANISRTAYETNVRKLRGEKDENSDNFGGKKAAPFKKGNDAHDGAEDSDFTKKKDDEDKDENSDNFGGKKAPPFKKGGGKADDEEDGDDSSKEEAARRPRPPQSYNPTTDMASLVKAINQVHNKAKRLKTAEGKKKSSSGGEVERDKPRSMKIRKIISAVEKWSKELDQLK